jgi:hypothetical protein
MAGYHPARRDLPVAAGIAGRLGVREAGLVIFLGDLGIPGETALAASLCIGLSQILVGLLGGLIWLSNWDIGSGGVRSTVAGDLMMRLKPAFSPINSGKLQIMNIGIFGGCPSASWHNEVSAERRGTHRFDCDRGGSDRISLRRASLKPKIALTGSRMPVKRDIHD